MTKYLYLFAVCILITGFNPVLAQDRDLPRYMTEEEKEIWPYYLQSLKSERQSGNLPEKPIRTMGEWEEIQALFISWKSFPGILTQIVEHAVKEVKVYIITEEEQAVENTLRNAGISLDNVEFVNWPSNTVWIRDYGPWAVYENDVEQLAISDYIYNRPRPFDDAIPERVADLFDVPHYAAVNEPYDWVHTGGNNLVDGYLKGYSSEITLRENPGKTEAEIDYIASRLFGYEEYVKMTELPFDGISHLDMHIRFIDEETLIGGEYPEGVADGPQIEENIEHFLNNHSTSFGNPYNIKRIPMPPGSNGNYPDQGGPYRTFTNSIFLNGTILVPIYEEQYDTVGLRIYRENLPGYNVVGIDCNAMINSFGALHCITKTVGVDDPLWIAHPRIRDQYDNSISPEVRAKVKHRDGIETVTLHYRTATDSLYQEVAMEATGEDFWYAGEIPAMDFGTEVHYYIRATAGNGKIQNRPIVAPEGYFHYHITAPEKAPVAAFSSNIESLCPGGSVRFLDRSEGGVVSRQWIFDGGQPMHSEKPNPSVQYDQPGTYDVVLIAENDLGTDTLYLEEYVKIEGGIDPFPEDFSAGIDETVWDNRDHGTDNYLWTAFEGSNCYDNRAIRADNFNDDNRGVNTVLEATFDLSGFDQPQLYFSYAYAPFNADFGDGLEVKIENCEGESEVVFLASGFDLATAPATGDVPFIPVDCSEWTDVVADLTDFYGDHVKLRFTNQGGWGNFLYLDNIMIKDAAVPNERPTVSFAFPHSDTLIQTEFPLEIPISLRASDPDGFISEVSLSANGFGIADFDLVPYEYTLEIDQPGTYLLRATSTDNEGAESEAAEITVVAEDLETSVLFENGEIELTVYPNPAGEKFFLNLEGNLNCSSASWELRDMTGKKIIPQSPLKEGTQAVEVGHLPSGTYHLSVKVCESSYRDLLIITR